MTTSQRERFEALIARVSARRTLFAALQSRVRQLQDATYWAELESGANIAVGDRVRYLGRWYVCTQAHTKALLRLPSNETYWRAEE